MRFVHFGQRVASIVDLHICDNPDVEQMFPLAS
jgi:hypothetical protein